MTAFVANTNLLELSGLKDEITEAFINDATVTVTVKNEAGTNISGVTWPLTMTYVAASDGVYRAALSNALALVHQTKYVAHIEANGGANKVGHFEHHFKGAARKTTD